MHHITKLEARQILDSRGNPTVEAEVALADGTRRMAAVPSGASTGRFEALELRDGGTTWGGKGVEQAVENIERLIAPALSGLDPRDYPGIDELLCALDATANKSKLGANAMLAVSLASARAGAAAAGQSFYRFLGGEEASTLPVPMMNILNGGAHATNNIDIQEFMIMPVGASCFREGLRWCVEIYHTLAGILRGRNLATAVGDEGGFAPDLADGEAAIACILQAVEEAGYRPGEQILLAIDAAASEWVCEEGGYRMPKSGREFTAETLCAYWEELCDNYPIISLEDPLGEEDWEGWQMLTAKLGDRVQLVGDDLFVTNTERLQRGIQSGCANAILIKPNQIGTLSETLDAIRMAQQAGYATIISHRSGETEDTAIADLAVATNAGQIKTGAPCRTERTAKYNRLLRIEERLGTRAGYLGNDCFRLVEQK